MVTHFLQYGQRDQGFFQAYRDQFDVLSIPGTVASYYPDSTSALVRVLAKPYIIDPLTPVLQAPVEGPARGAHSTLAAWHSLPDGRDSVTALDLIRDPQFLEGMLEGVVEAQASYTAWSQAIIEKYLKLLGREKAFLEGGRLLALLPPYFLIQQRHDDWQRVSKAVLERVPKLAPRDTEVWPVLCVSKRLVASRDALRVHDDLGMHEFDTMVLILDGVLEESEHWRVLDGLSEAVHAWAGQGQRVICLFSGYFSVLLTKFGLAGVGHGVGYGDRRRVCGRASGSPLPRYYMNSLHCMMPRGSAERLLRQLPPQTSPCACPSCRAHDRGGRPVAREMTMAELLVHFLHARHTELQRVISSPVSQLVAELEESFELVKDSEPSFSPHVRHLATWAGVLRAAAARFGSDVPL